MNKSTLLAGALSLAMITPVMAGHCPLDAKAIDKALQTTSLSAAQKSEVQALRDKGMELHKSGDHKKSEQNLAKAMRMLLEAE
ncbi:hypothetical protein D0544_10995 [Aestuariirhabdus litorea]|uniref:Uncharacterized protein n=2 Tax=Aestuariirhabdus litorea TaxID=2528527 RepID=A0A3P3VMA5_9GAMM|nr:hypothetical protein D0544_10995 [Aestuariirhabdus litorea]RWW93640.1 hypothetical protein DZC74_10975 [Endozoicomonadaceae bacterium GTF-13]